MGFDFGRKSTILSRNTLQGSPIGTPRLGLQLLEHLGGRGLSYRGGEVVGV